MFKNEWAQVVIIWALAVLTAVGALVYVNSIIDGLAKQNTATGTSTGLTR